MDTNTLPERTFQEGLCHHLHDLALRAQDLQQWPDDRRLRERTGYAALHAARYVAEMVYRARHGVEDVAPGLRGVDALPASLGNMRNLLQEVRATPVSMDAGTALHALTAMHRALSRRDDPHDVAVSCAMAGWLLLGTRDLGGVMSAWQLPVVFFDFMTWNEHADFNQFILEHARELYRPSADAVASEFGLPNLDFLMAGCLGNIAKACYRAVAEESTQNDRFAASDRGDTAMLEIEETFSQATRDQLLFPTMRAMRAASAGATERPQKEREFWQGLKPAVRNTVLREVRRIEPSKALVQLVQNSCAKSTQEASQ